MKSIVTNAAGITVLRLIDNTLKTGGGPVSIGATVIQAQKGPVGKVCQVNYQTWETVFGKPYSKTIADRTQMEGLRHLNDAAKECIYVNAVRVVSADAQFPSLEMLVTQDKGAWAQTTPYVEGDVVAITGPAKLICVTAHTSSSTEPTSAAPEWDAFESPMEKSNHSYGTPIAAESGYLCSIYPIDGDPCLNRSFKITAVNTDKERFAIQFYDKDDRGVEYLLEYWTVGVNPLDKDDMGRSVFIETILEERSVRFRCDWNVSMDWNDAIGSIEAVADLSAKTAFEGGTNGGTPTTQEWIAAWDMFRSEAVTAYLMFAAGCYDMDVLQNCIDIAELRHTMFFLDVPCYQNQSVIAGWINSAAFDTRFAAAYHCPIAANDEWYGGKTIWGASGAVVAACANGDANYSGETPGIHYSPAGRIRGRLSRTAIEFIYPEDVVDRDALVELRINPIVPGPTGGAIIDDALTLNSLENYSRFVWVNRIANYIDYRFLEMASQLQHEPDRLTADGLTRGMTKILGDLVISGALSPPRSMFTASPYSVNAYAATDTNPYVFLVTQPEIDRWLVEWSFCPTGSARRIVGQPIMVL